MQKSLPEKPDFYANFTFLAGFNPDQRDTLRAQVIRQKLCSN
jgi:hypothetical protein